MASWPPSRPKGSRAGAHSTSRRTTRSLRSPTAPPPRRLFSLATRVPECGPSLQRRTNRTTVCRTPSTDGAGAWSLVWHVRSAVLRTFRSVVHPGGRSSDGRSGRVPCTPRPSARWCIRNSACGTPTGGRSHFANVSIFHPETSARVLARAAPSAHACRPVPSAHSSRAATTWRRASRTSRAVPARDVSPRDASPGTRVRWGAKRLTMRRRAHFTCGRFSPRGGAMGNAREHSMMRSITDDANLSPVVDARGKRG